MGEMGGWKIEREESKIECTPLRGPGTSLRRLFISELGRRGNL
jgi:hypothetical protein